MAKKLFLAFSLSGSCSKFVYSIDHRWHLFRAPQFGSEVFFPVRETARHALIIIHRVSAWLATLLLLLNAIFVALLSVTLAPMTSHLHHSCHTRTKSSHAPRLMKVWRPHGNGPKAVSLVSLRYFHFDPKQFLIAGSPSDLPIRTYWLNWLSFL